jgi:hypothetical protein
MPAIISQLHVFKYEPKREARNSDRVANDDSGNLRTEAAAMKDLQYGGAPIDDSLERRLTFMNTLPPEEEKIFHPRAIMVRSAVSRLLRLLHLLHLLHFGGESECSLTNACFD